MAALADVAQQIFTRQIPAEYILADLSLASGKSITDQALQRANARRIFETRTLPDIANRRGARSSFYSGQTGVQMQRAGEDLQMMLGQAEYDTQNVLADLVRQRAFPFIGRA